MTSDLRGAGGPWELRRDGVARGRYRTELDALADLHRLQGSSWHHAMKHEGWTLKYTPGQNETVGGATHCEITTSIPYIREGDHHEES